MKILLIYPNWGDSMYMTLPIGLASIAAVLLKEGHEVKALDCTALDMNIEQTKRYISRFKPDLIGISTMTPTIKMAIALARASKEVSKAKVAVGGVHASICPEEIIKEKAVDYVITSEGEITFKELAKELEKKNPNIKKIDGIIHKEIINTTKTKKNNNKKNKDKNKTEKDPENKIKIIKNRPRELVEDLDSLPIPAVHLFPVKKYKQSTGESDDFITMTTSRGCPYICTYCINSCDALFGKKYRAMSPKRTIEEIEYYIKRYKVKEIDFYDDNFTFNRDRVEKICDLIIKKRLKFKWKCSSRIESIDMHLLKKMKKAGCYIIAYGVESGNEQILKSVHRYTDMKKLKKAFRLTHKAGIKTIAYFMVGYPDETKKTINDTIRFAIDIDPTYAQFAIITPYPHTEIFDEYKKNNLLVETDWSKFNYTGEMTSPVIRSKHLSAEELHKEYKKAISKFYMRPRYIFKQIISNLNIRGIKKNINGFRQIMKWI